MSLRDLRIRLRGGWRCRAVPEILVGVDIASIDAVNCAMDRFGERYLRRVFTAREVEDSDAACTLVRAGSLAARFAAKEATFKLLGTGDLHPPWIDVELRRAGDGSCSIHLSGAAAAAAARRDVQVLNVSLSHEGDTAAAVVVGTRRQGPSRWCR